MPVSVTVVPLLAVGSGTGSLGSGPPGMVPVADGVADALDVGVGVVVGEMVTVGVAPPEPCSEPQPTSANATRHVRAAAGPTPRTPARTRIPDKTPRLDETFP
jgi:hypothetical protein